MEKFAKVIVNLSYNREEKVYTYKIPDIFLNEIQIGMRVIVPFGYGNKNYEAYVVNIVDEIDFPIENAKNIISMPDAKPMFSIEMLKLAKYMKTKYYCNFIECLNVMKPSGLKFETEYVLQLIGEKKSLSQKGEELFDYIYENDNKVAESEILENFGPSIKRTIKSLQEKQIIERVQLSQVKDLTQRVKVAYLNYELDNFDERINEILKKEDAKSKIIKFLQDNQKARITELISIFKISRSPIETLKKYKVINIETEEVLRNINYSVYKESKEEKTLTYEQQNAINFIEEKRLQKSKKPIALFGATGSGKTEVYIKIIENVLKEGKQAIVLVPEISLTPQTVSRFINRFGDKVGVTHSRLSNGERFDEWKKARDNKISIIIGARSAIFTPFDNLGVIIIDEEHENTYKSETTPKYDAKDVAKEIIKNTDATLILGSATPSIDTFYKTEINEYDIVTMQNRVNNNFPEVKIIDMREELKDGNNSMFSLELLKAMEDALSRDEQIILFLNKRGSASFVSCRACGYVCECDSCSVSYTYHSHRNILMCHYCGRQIKNPTVCPKCNSTHIRYFGVGTQRVEAEVKKIFDVEVARMDFDTTSGKDGHRRILDKFRKKEAKILVGTQMIAKGLDFEDVTVVGVVAGDMSINNGDYRSGETTFQILTQVSGRAGRADKEGKVYIQTYEPMHYSIVESAKNDYNGFYKQEISLRKSMNYPPFSNIFVVMFTGENEKEVIQLLFNLKQVLIKNNSIGYMVYNPTPAVISKIKKRYRWKIIIKGEDEVILRNFVVQSVNEFRVKNNVNNININLNLNPTVIS